MTIQSLLKIHGRHCPRVVLPSGVVVFGPSVGSAPEALPLPSHTFHGGEDRQDVDPDDTSAWWDDPTVAARERDAMERFFPSFVELLADDGLPPAWAGVITTALGARYEIVIVHRRDHSLPLVIPVNPKRRVKQVGRRSLRAPHLYDRGSLCVADISEWDPDVHTAATVIAWAAHWHACYEEWRFTGTWPIESYVARAS